MVNRLNRRVHDGGAPVPVLTAIVHAQEADEINFPAASAAAKSAIRSAITPKSPLGDCCSEVLALKHESKIFFKTVF